jgi:hypothetical protein
MYSTKGESEVYIKFYPGILQGRYDMEDLDIDGRTILKWTLKMRIPIGLIWLKIRYGGMLL